MLVAPGRSGTTLMSCIFAARSDASSCGETVDLVFDLWNAAQRSISHITPENLDEAVQSVDTRVGEFVRNGFLAMLRDDKKYWFHKPIGIPTAFSPALFDVDSWDERAETYWRVMRNSFPQAKVFTILRHPCDVVMSYKQRFNDVEQGIWATLGFVAHIAQHRDSMVAHAVPYDRLITDQDATMAALLDFAGLPDDGSWRKAFASVHSSGAQLQSSSTSGFTWRDRWSELDLRHAHPRFVEPIRALHHRFNHPLSGMEEGVGLRARTNPGAVPLPEGHVPEISADVGARLRNLELLWEERATRLESDLHVAYMRVASEFQASFRTLESGFEGANREAIAHLKNSYDQMESALAELTALRANPLVRLMKRLGLFRLAGKRPLRTQE
jgi:hypothetical protein